MYARYMTLILLPPLAGCAATTTLDTPAPTGDTPAAIATATALQDGEAPLAASVVETIALQELNQRTVCEDIRRTGSRIVVARRCYTPDADSVSDAQRREVVQQQLDDLRREQEAMERMAREREREMERQRTMMMQQNQR